MKLLFKCDECLTSFYATLDHGKPRRFCSRTCFQAKAQRRNEKECKQCGNVFKPRNDQRHQFCTVRCRMDAKIKGEMEPCIWCKKEFHRRPSCNKFNRDRCCSIQCRNEFYKEERSHAYQKGFYTHTQLGEKQVLIHREGWVGEYMGEHRLIASRVIGRMLTRKEYVIRINRNPEDNREENLFICDISEFGRRNRGSLAWPTESNLYTYEVK